jgi:ribosomal protein L40E
VRCPKCGARNEEGAKYCEVCGYNFVRKRDDIKRNTLIDTLSITEKKICKKCGWVNSAENIFCEKCGGELEILHTEEKYKPKAVISSVSSVKASQNIAGATLNNSYASVLIALGIIASYILGILTAKIL